MSIYDRIKSKADEKKISIKALERESGLGNGVIKRWNETSPQCNKLEKVANYLQVSIEWLITGKENKDLSDEENEIIIAYKNAAPAIQEAVRKLLDVPEKSEKSSDLKSG